jgi:hypothetical protein
LGVKAELVNVMASSEHGRNETSRASRWQQLFSRPARKAATVF